MKKINVLFSPRVEFKTITENLKLVLSNSEKVNLIVIDKNKELNQLVSIMQETDFDIFLHKNEHCQFNTCSNIKKAIDFCYKTGKIPAYIDFGYFGHYQNYIIDYYLPNSESSIKKRFPHLSSNLFELQKNIENYIDEFRENLNCLKDSNEWINLNLIDKKFVVIWAQYDISLLRNNFKYKEINNNEWMLRLSQQIKKNNFIPVIKISPCEIKYDLDILKKEAIVLTSQKDQSEKFGINYIKDINLYLNKYAHSHIINCSSISNELLLNNCKITAMGKSWFNDLEIFHEPNNWNEVMVYKNQNQINVNKWINWWNLRQFQINELSNSIEKIFIEFKANN
jgi:hypothetical protein